MLETLIAAWRGSWLIGWAERRNDRTVGKGDFPGKTGIAGLDMAAPRPRRKARAGGDIAPNRDRQLDLREPARIGKLRLGKVRFGKIYDER
jgi:hypothetical protein